LLDQNLDEIAVEPLTGFNLLKTHTVTAGGVCGRTFYFDEFDYSTYYRYRKYILIDYAPIVEIDIKPGTDPNPINPGSNGLVPVAILSSEDFDARTVDETTVELAGAFVAIRGKNKYMAHVEDVNGDGLPDLVVQVKTQDLNLSAGGTVELTGETFDGEDIVGYDEVVVGPPEG
jgi:hypothetical protein